MAHQQDRKILVRLRRGDPSVWFAFAMFCSDANNADKLKSLVETYREIGILGLQKLGEYCCSECWKVLQETLVIFIENLGVVPTINDPQH